MSLLREDLATYRAAQEALAVRYAAMLRRESRELQRQLHNPLGRLRRQLRTAEAQYDRLHELYLEPSTSQKRNFLATGLLLSELLELRVERLRQALRGADLPWTIHTQKVQVVYSHELDAAFGRDDFTEAQVATAVLKDGKRLIRAANARHVHVTAEASMMEPDIFYLKATMPAVYN